MIEYQSQVYLIRYETVIDMTWRILSISFAFCLQFIQGFVSMSHRLCTGLAVDVNEAALGISDGSRFSSGGESRLARG